MDGLKALIAVEKHGTVSQAAIELRLTQSAVSKRLRALENDIGSALVERDGRRLRLTTAGLEILAKAKPLLCEVENLRLTSQPGELRELSLGIADSIAASWGPSALKRALKRIPGLKLEIHVHRSTLIVENVKLGRYNLGLICHRGTNIGLSSASITAEEMVIVGHRVPNQKILTIETASATWQEIGQAVLAHPRFVGKSFEFVESFAAAAQLARQGFGQALVPIEIAKALGLKPTEIISLAPKLSRQVHLVGRKTVFELEVVKEFSRALSETAQ